MCAGKPYIVTGQEFGKRSVALVGMKVREIRDTNLSTSMDKIALITGSSSGIGLLTAVDMAKAGFRVIATMRDLSRNTRLLQAAANAGVSDRIEVKRLDITEFDLLPAAVA